MTSVRDVCVLAIWLAIVPTCTSDTTVPLNECDDETCADSVSMLMTKKRMSNEILESVLGKEAKDVGSALHDKVWEFLSSLAQPDENANAEGNEHFPEAKVLTYDDEVKRCPKFLGDTIIAALNLALATYEKDTSQIALLLKLFGLKDWASPVMNPNVIDDFSMTYYFGVRSAVTGGESIPASSVKPPKLYGAYDRFKIRGIEVPAVEFDKFGETTAAKKKADAQHQRPEHVADSTTVCLLGVALNAPVMNDLLHNRWKNNWRIADVGPRSKFKTKKEFILSFWNGYTLQGGAPAWPKEEMNWNKFYFKNDEWDDRLEQALILNNIGAHRVQKSEKQFGGQRLPLVVKFNDPYSTLEVRPGFGRYGVDMYFTEDGIPALAVTPDGKNVQRGDKNWQYYKFVWRSSLLGIVTLVDHLHMTHYRVANALATASRVTLPPTHPLRVLMTIFTFGTIEVNYLSLFSLQDNRGALNRVLPFKDFDGLNNYVTTHLPTPSTIVEPFFNESAFREVPKQVQKSPYYEDGKLIVQALSSLVSKYIDIFYDEMCHKETDTITDMHVGEFIRYLMDFFDTSAYSTTIRSVSESTCTGAKQWLSAYLYVVTAYHRHVGQVGDFASDPDLIGLSWKEGEASSRPSQAFITAAIAGATGSPRPKLRDEYGQVFAGMQKESEVRRIWQSYQEELDRVIEVVGERNSKRKNINLRGDPRAVETSVAV